MASKNNKSARTAGSAGGVTPWNSIFDLLNRMLDFLAAKFRSLPPSLQAIAYFIVLMFFCATAWRLVAGQYVIRGVVWEGDRFGQGYEIVINTDRFSTNSSGVYYALVSASQYARFAVARDLRFDVVRHLPDGKSARVAGAPFPVEFSWWDAVFSAIQVNALVTAPPTSTASPAESPAAHTTTQERRPHRFELFPTAYAQPQRQPLPAGPQPPMTSTGVGGRDRLIIEDIVLGSDAVKMSDVKFDLEAGDDEWPLLVRGIEAGRLPLKQRVAFGTDYYFDVPSTLRGTKVDVEMQTPGFFGLFAREEEFTVEVPAQYNVIVPVRGSRGSVLRVRLVPAIIATTPPD